MFDDMNLSSLDLLAKTFLNEVLKQRGSGLVSKIVSLEYYLKFKVRKTKFRVVVTSKMFASRAAAAARVKI